MKILPCAFLLIIPIYCQAQEDLDLNHEILKCLTTTPQPNEIRFEYIESNFKIPTNNVWVQIQTPHRPMGGKGHPAFYLGAPPSLHRHMSTLTFVNHHSGDPLTKAVYFHGNDNELAIYIPEINFRKFFFFPLNVKPGESGFCMRSIQSFFEEFNRKDKIYCRRATDGEVLISSLKPSNPIAALLLTNNCREAGNFELKILNRDKKFALKTHFMLPLEKYDELLKLFNEGIGIAESQSGIRTNAFYREAYQNQDGFIKTVRSTGNIFQRLKAKFVSWYTDDLTKDESGYLWHVLPNLSKIAKNCKIDQLNHVIPRAKKFYKSGEIIPIEGKIQYSEFIVETQDKSSSMGNVRNRLSYVKTPCKDRKDDHLIKLGPPEGFIVLLRDEVSDLNPIDYWNARTCKIAPHTFINYEDIKKYDLHLSSFEVDGIYNGNVARTNQRAVQLSSDERSRWDFTPEKFIYDYHRFELYQDENSKFIEIRLLNKNDGRDITISNINFNELISLENNKKSRINGIWSLFGIGAQQLVSNYNGPYLRKVPVTVFMHKKDGTIVNHHLKDSGVEQIYVRKSGCNLIIDLVSHERIVPLWRGSINYNCPSNSVASIKTQ